MTAVCMLSEEGVVSRCVGTENQILVLWSSSQVLPSAGPLPQPHDGSLIGFIQWFSQGKTGFGGETEGLSAILITQQRDLSQVVCLSGARQVSPVQHMCSSCCALGCSLSARPATQGVGAGFTSLRACVSLRRGVSSSVICLTMLYWYGLTDTVYLRLQSISPLFWWSNCFQLWLFRAVSLCLSLSHTPILEVLSLCACLLSGTMRYHDPVFSGWF